MLEIMLELGTLLHHIHDESRRIIDCRFSFADPERGIEETRCTHVPAGVYVHKNEELPSTHIQGVIGRHPLPSVVGSEIQGDILFWTENN